MRTVSYDKISHFHTSKNPDRNNVAGVSPYNFILLNLSNDK